MFDRLNGIVIFVRAADAGSFAKAAEQLGLSRSAVGKAIARLEERLALRLFHRTTRSQRLTEDGQSFYERCRRIVTELDAVRAMLDADDDAPVGPLRVSAPVLLGRMCAAPVLTSLVSRHRQMDLDLRLTDRMVDIVDERIDLAVRIGPLPDSSGLVATSLGTFDMSVCAAPAYLASRGTPARLEDLDDHECVPYARRGGRIEPWRIETEDAKTVDLQVHGRIRCDDLETIVQAAVQGCGIVCLPTWLVNGRLRSGELVRVLEGCRAPGNRVYAVWPRGPVPSRVRVAIDELKRVMPARLGG